MGPTIVFLYFDQRIRGRATSPQQRNNFKHLVHSNEYVNSHINSYINIHHRDMLSFRSKTYDILLLLLEQKMIKMNYHKV